MGAGEGKDVTLDIVKLVDSENDEVLLYFDRISQLPAKVEYHDINDRGVRQRHVEEFSQWFHETGSEYASACGRVSQRPALVAAFPAQGHVQQ